MPSFSFTLSLYLFPPLSSPLSLSQLHFSIPCRLISNTPLLFILTTPAVSSPHHCLSNTSIEIRHLFCAVFLFHSFSLSLPSSLFPLSLSQLHFSIPCRLISNTPLLFILTTPAVSSPHHCLSNTSIEIRHLFCAVFLFHSISSILSLPPSLSTTLCYPLPLNIQHSSLIIPSKYTSSPSFPLSSRHPIPTFLYINLFFLKSTASGHAP